MAQKPCGRLFASIADASAQPAYVLGDGVLGLELRRLHEEVVGRAVEQLAREREGLHTRDALHVHDLHVLPKELRGIVIVISTDDVARKQYNDITMERYVDVP